MKTPLLFFFIFFTFLTFSQTNIDSLEKEKIELKDKILDLNERLALVENKISHYESEKILNNVEVKPFDGIARKGAFILDKPSVAGNVLFKLDEATSIQIVDYFSNENFYQICIEKRCGYISSRWIKIDADLGSWKALLAEKKAKENKEFAEKKLKQDLIKEKEVRKKEEERMLAEYGRVQVNKMKARKFWIGMNKEMLEFAIGEPENIKKSVGSWGTHEQWIYKSGTYIYIENGKVTSYQQ